MENETLIKLLETEMRKDVKDIPVSQELEVTPENIQATLQIVREWYTEAEKIIRVLSNVLAHPMNQAVNQLRYAGHHILKSQTSLDSQSAQQSNLVEAFKHCKRAVYDALDFYVYTLHEQYRLSPCFDSQEAIKAESSLRRHIEKIQEARYSQETRIKYYENIQEELVEGLKLIEKFNEFKRATGIPQRALAEKAEIALENARLQASIEEIQRQNTQLEQKLAKKFGSLLGVVGIVFALLLACAAPIGLIIADKYITTKHEITLPSPLVVNPQLPIKFPLNSPKNDCP